MARLLHVDLFAHRHGRAHEGQGARAHLRRTAGVKVAGRRLRSGYPRSRNRMLAGRNPDRVQGGHQRLRLNQNLRASDLPLDPKKMKLVDRSGTRSFARRRTARRRKKSPPKRRRCGAAPAEPEVIKKGKKEVEGEEGEEGEKGAKAEKTEKKK